MAADAQDKNFSRDDLFLLMKSYENSVQQNTILLTQQQKLIEQQEKMLQKQGEVCESTRRIVDRLSSCDTNAEHSKHTIIGAINSFGEVISHETQKISTAVITTLNEQTTKMVKLRSDCKEEHNNVISKSEKGHNKIKLKIYGSYAFLGGMIIALVTLVIKAYERTEIISEIAHHLGLL